MSVTEKLLIETLSLPLWECGLKSLGWLAIVAIHPSLPLWECGLKFHRSQEERLGVLVTPLVGVWIEITHWVWVYPQQEVTPLVGVWIEIIFSKHRCGYNASLPLWEWGLKYLHLLLSVTGIRSLPLWECGLKYCKEGADVSSLESLPLWECGLKYVKHGKEINNGESLPLWECGLKSSRMHSSSGCRCHSPCGSVDWNLKMVRNFIICAESLPLWECGLKLIRIVGVFNSH